MGRRQSSAAGAAAASNNSDGSADDSDMDRRQQLEKERQRRRRRRRERRLDIPAFIGGEEDGDVGADPTPAQAEKNTNGDVHDDDDSSIGQDDMMAAAAAARPASSSSDRRRARWGSITSRGSLRSRNSLTLKEQKLLNSSHGAIGDSSLHGDSSGRLTLEHKNATAANDGSNNPTNNNWEDHDELASALAILDTYNEQVADPTSETVALTTQDEGGDGWADHHDHQINPRSGVLLERYRYASISDLSKTHSQFTASTNGTSRTGGTALSSLTGATKATMLSSATNVASNSVYEAFNMLVEETVEEAAGANKRVDGAGEDSTSSPLSNTSENNNQIHKYDFIPRPRANIPSLEEPKDSQNSATPRRPSAKSIPGRSRRLQSKSATPKDDEHNMPSGHRHSSAKSALNRSQNQRPSITSTSARHQTNTYPSSRSHQHRRSTLSVNTDTDDDETMHRRFIAVRDNRQLHPGKIDARIPSISSSQRSANEADCASKSDNLLRVKKDAPGGKVNHTETRPKSKGRRGSAILSDGEQEADPFDAWFDAYNRLMYGEKEAIDVESTNEVATMPTGSTQLQDDLRRLSLASLDSLTPRRSSDCQHPPQNLMALTEPLESCPPRQSQQYDSLRRNAESIQRMADITDNSLSTKSRRNLNSSIGNGVKAVKRIIKRKSADLKRRSTGGKSTGPGNVRGDPSAITAASSSASLSVFQEQQQSRRHSSNDIKTIRSTLSQFSASSRRHSAGPVHVPDAAAHTAAAAAQSSESYKSLGSQKSLDDSYDSELEGEDGRNHTSLSMGMNALPSNSSFTPRMA